MKFKMIDGSPVADVAAYIKKYVADRPDNEIDIMIGCDSLPKAKKFATYTVVIALYNVGKGAHLLYSRETRVKVTSIYNRLWQEVEKSLEVAQYLEKEGIFLIKNIRGLNVHLHLDVNSEAGGGANKSNAILDSAVGYITSMGFKCTTKPNAPAASYAADFICRGKEVAYKN